jgi:hypothetical protein
LESLAPPGVICVSRIVYEHVADELSVKFDDIGQQHVKNIPNPVHAYMIAPYRENSGDTDGKSQTDATRRRRRRLSIGAAIVVAMVAASIAAALQLYKFR